MVVSRRCILRSLTAPLGVALARRIAGMSVGLDLAKEFTESSVAAIAPDGSKLCLQDWAVDGRPIRVVEVGTWRTTYSGVFRPVALSAQFFDGGDKLFVQSTASRVIVDATTGERTEHRIAYDRRERDDYFPAGMGTLLSVHQDSLAGEARTLALLELPGYREVVNVPYATLPRKPHPVKDGLALSTDRPPVQADSREVLAYSFNNVLVCRHTEDLVLLWARSVEPDAEFINLAISADGASIAASVGDPSVDDLTRLWRQHYLGIYDGHTGEEITRLTIDGTKGVALSPHGELIAFISQERGEKGVVVPTVSLHEIPSGRKLASVTHGPLKRGRHQWLESGITVGFTSDGKYLITSGMATRVWGLGNLIGQPETPLGRQLRRPLTK
jgi:hypothetical protein